MDFPELFVKYLQRYVPTWLLRLLLRWNLKLLIGPQMRLGDVVVKQIKCDRHDRKEKPVTTAVETTNFQLYGNDPVFFKAHLGPALKYSACEFPSSVKSLAEAEDYTLAVYQEKLGLASMPAGSRILELGCGWGSLSLSNAARFPKLNFVCFSNSPQQIDYIKSQAAERKLSNLTLHVEDYAIFNDPEKSTVAPSGALLFDAAIAIETIEHAQNISELLGSISLRLKPGATLFVHSLLHQSSSYLMGDTWMGRNFFTGGSILALNSYYHLAPPSLYLEDVQPVNGIGYSKTLLAWLALMESKRAFLVDKYGSDFYEGFRMFYISCAEAFAANNGNEFMCGYYTFRKLDLR